MSADFKPKVLSGTLTCLAALTAVLLALSFRPAPAFAEDAAAPAAGKQGDAAKPDEKSAPAVLAEKEKKIGPFRYPAGTPLEDIVRWIAGEVGVNIVLGPKVDEKLPKEVSLPKRTYWRDVLNHIAELTNCEVTEVSPELFKLTQPPKVKMTFRNAKIQVVLDLLARQAGANIVISPEVDGTVSLTLNDVRWDIALDTIVKTLGFIIVKEEGNIIRVVTRDSLKAQLETRIFQLSYIRPPDDYRAVMDTGGAGGTESAKSRLWARKDVKDLGPVKMKDSAGREYTEYFSSFALYMALREMVSVELGGRLRYDAGTNSFLITDTKPKLDEMEAIIKQVDLPPEQVFIDVKFIRTTTNLLDEHGIHFDSDATPSEEDGVILRQYFPSAADSARSDPTIYNRGGSYYWDVGRWESLRQNFNMLGILDFTQTNMVLRLINSDQNTRIIQAPKLLTLNHQESVIFVGQSVPYVKQEASIDQSGSLKITISQDPNSPISVGFTLFVTPHVVKNSDEIMLTVIPRTSNLIGTSSKENPGFSQFKAQIAEGVWTYLDLPMTLDQTIVTKMLVRSGFTAVIGGLISEDRRESESRVPILSALPLIGNIFTWKRTTAQKENLVIFITPRIIRGKMESLDISRELVKKQRELDYFDKHYSKTDPTVIATTEEQTNLGEVATREEAKEKAEYEMRAKNLDELNKAREAEEKKKKEEEGYKEPESGGSE